MARKKKAKGTSLEAAIANIESKFGKGSIMNLTDTNIEPVDVISTGSIRIDKALGVGGIPQGKITEIYGPESSGKTTLAIHILANAQKLGQRCVYIDVEHTFDPRYAKALGVNLDELYISQPTTGEEALGIVEQFAETGDVGLIVVDSVAALTPKAELEGEMGDAHVGLLARLMSQALRKLTALANNNGTTLVFVNQLRANINSFGFGNNEITPGGKALKYYASMRLDVRRIGAIKVKDQAVGNKTKIKVAKNKVAPPFSVVEVDLIFGKGFVRENDLMDSGLALGLVTKEGNTYIYDEGRAVGREKFINLLHDNVELSDALEKNIKDIWFKDVR